MAAWVFACPGSEGAGLLSLMVGLRGAYCQGRELLFQEGRVDMGQAETTERPLQG